MPPIDNNKVSIAARDGKVRRLLLFQKLFIFVTAFLVYANSIPNDFNLDDELYSTRAMKLAEDGWHGISRAFTERTFMEGEDQYQYRPIALASFVIQYELIGANPHVSHLINLLLYALSCFLLFLLLLMWFGEERHWLAFFVSLLFALHPLHSEVVASIKNRDELLGFLFVIPGCIAAWTAVRRAWYLVPACLLFFFAMLCKLTVVPALLIVPLAYYFFSELNRKRIVVYTLVLLIATRIFSLTSRQLPPVHRTYFEHENPMYMGAVDLLHRSATAFYVMGRYTLLELFPYRLAYYYGQNYVPVVGWNDLRAIAALLFFILLAIITLKHFRKQRTLGFGLAVYVVCTVAGSNLILAMPGLMAERYAYIASLGFCIALCSGIYILLDVAGENQAWKAVRPKQLLLCMSAIAVLYAARTVARNDDWKNKYSLYTHDMPYLRSSAKANILRGDLLMNLAAKYRNIAIQLRQQDPALAKAYADSARKFSDTAIANFKQALNITPNLPSALSNLALAYFAADSQAQAREYFCRAIKVRPNDARLNCNLGVVYFKAGMMDSSAYMLKRALAADSSFAIAYQSLSDVQLLQHDTSEAIATLKTATRNILNPIAPYVDLGDIALHQKDTGNAVGYFEQAADLSPGSVYALSFLTQYYRRKGDMQKAGYYYNMLTELQKERTH
ncbi:MAG: tetratricopeptide repeat protein [Bacteroidetes bacterium]|nr:tetratricopeptide repeat protein [Bacteroidota bacterium]